MVAESDQQKMRGIYCKSYTIKHNRGSFCVKLCTMYQNKSEPVYASATVFVNYTCFELTFNSDYASGYAICTIRKILVGT